MMYSRYKQYVLGQALINAKTIFDRTKLELIFNIISIYIVIYILGSVPVILGQYWVLIGVQVIGFAFIIAMAVALRITKGIKVPRRIWFVSGIFFTLSSAVFNSGQASFITYAFAMANVVISFLMLGRFLRRIAIVYYSLFIIITLSITFNLVPMLSLPFDLSRENEFFDQPNIYAVIIALSMIVFIIDSFIKTHQLAAQQVLDQKEKVTQQKIQLEKKNETIRLSIDLAAKVQENTSINWNAINRHFTDSYYLNLSKEKLSGEFFWVKPYKDSVYFAVVDTGEIDVPGAMFAFMVKNGLEKAIQAQANPSPKSILNFMNRFMNKSIVQANGLDSNIKITLCQYSSHTKILHLVGVSQPIIVRKNGKLKTYFPKNHNLNYLDNTTEFDEAKIQLSTDDVIYLFTDGISDGKDNLLGKAIDYSDFKSELYLHNGKSFSETNSSITAKYDVLKKRDELKDDITIIGLKI